MNNPIKFESKMMMIRPNELKHDPRYQRPISRSRVARMAKSFDPSGIGALHVSLRDNGGKFVIDGLHRKEALIAAGYGDKPTRCIIYEGLTLAQEAHLFRILNLTNKTGAFDDWHAGVAEGVSECIALRDICKKHGVTISRTTKPGMVSCIVELRTIYRKEGGAKALDAALGVIQGAWPGIDCALEKPVLGGVARFILDRGKEIDLDRLTTVLAKYAGGPQKLIGQVRWQAENEPGTPGLGDVAAKIILSIYNTGLRSGRLAA